MARVEICSNDERYDDVSHGVAGYHVSDPSDTEFTKHHVLSTISHQSPISNSVAEIYTLIKRLLDL